MNATPVHETICERCGTCCRKGGPALHQEDSALFSGEGALELSAIVTFRRGERMFDQPLGRAVPLEDEVLKLRGVYGAWTCSFYDARLRACGLYDRRPVECRVLSCQDTAPLASMYAKDRLRRADLLPKGHAINAVIAEHEALVPAGRVAPLAGLLRAGGQEALDAEAELGRMALADKAFRKSLGERAGIAPEYHDFFLGRSAAALFAAAGLSLRDDARLGCRVQPDPLWRPDQA